MTTENENMNECVEATGGTTDGMSLEQIREATRRASVHAAMIRLANAIIHLADSNGSNLLSHARNELNLINMDDEDKMNILAIVAMFSSAGHSGGSASITTSMISDLLRFNTLSPLTGADEEWVEVGNGIFQNKRQGNIFKENGEAYNIDGYVFRDRNGDCYTGYESRKSVTFPYTYQKPIYVDMPYSLDELHEIIDTARKAESLYRVEELWTANTRYVNYPKGTDNKIIVRSDAADAIVLGVDVAGDFVFDSEGYAIIADFEVIQTSSISSIDGVPQDNTPEVVEVHRKKGFLGINRTGTPVYLSDKVNGRFLCRDGAVVRLVEKL